LLDLGTIGSIISGTIQVISNKWQTTSAFSTPMTLTIRTFRMDNLPKRIFWTAREAEIT
jgi:hypothetical protein